MAADAADHVVELLRAGVDVAAGMKAMIAWCERASPHPGWARFAALDFDAEGARCRAWARSLIAKHPPGPDITELYFGLFNPVRDDERVVLEIYVAGTRDEWLTEPGWWPEGRCAESLLLAELYAIACASDGLGEDAEYPLGLAFAVLLAADLARTLPVELLGAAGERRIVAGFDGGDILAVGRLDAAGFHVTAPRG